MIEIHVANQHPSMQADPQPLEAAVRAILVESEIDEGELSLAIVDDPTIHQLNRQYLNHDYPTDVLSFPLQSEGTYLAGEVIVSLDTAAKMAAEAGWAVADELLLYVIHGTLHLVGYDDKDPAAEPEMRAAERRHLARWGRQLPSASTTSSTSDASSLTDEASGIAKSPATGSREGGRL